MNPLRLKLAGRQSYKMVWFLAISVLVFGYYVITQQYEGKIAQSLGQAQSYDEKTRANRRLLSQSGPVKYLRDHVRSSLSGMMLNADQSATTSEFLRDADDLARRNECRILSVTPQTETAGSVQLPSPHPSSTPRVVRSALAQNAVDLAVRGRFGSLLSFLSQLPRRHVLLKIGDVRFAVSGARGNAAKPVLEAKIRLVLYRFAKPQILGEN